MREIKYRAWDKEDKRMIVDKQDFIPLIVTNFGVMKLDPTIKEKRWILLPRERFVLMQSTGLTDKNGVEVYEGDVVFFKGNHSCDDWIGVVEFKDFALQCVDTAEEEDMFLCDLICGGILDGDIIGNIHNEVSK